MLLLGLVVVLVVMGLAVVFVPPEVVRRQEARHHERLSFEQRLAAETELRRLTTETCGAVLLLGGLVLGWQELQQTRDEATVREERAERQLHGERYARAVGLLTSDDEIARVGGVNALAALARSDDARMHWSAMQTLAVFVKDRAGAASCGTAADAHEPPPLHEDLRLAVMSLGARDAPDDDAGLGMRRIGLRDTDLQGRLLRGDLSGWILQGACLHDADLARTDLRGAVLARADLTAARLSGTRLDAATNLRDAALAGACFAGATFEAQPAGLAWATLFAEACVRGAAFPGDVRAPAAEPCARCPAGGR